MLHGNRYSPSSLDKSSGMDYDTDAKFLRL